MDKPELDYAFLADFSQVQDNKLTAVGASYTDILVANLPQNQMLYVAGRIRCPVAMESVSMRLEIVPPQREYEIVGDLELAHNNSIRPYNDRYGLLFSVGIAVPLQSAGLYEVLIDIDGKRARRLAFEVMVATSQS